MVRKDLFQKCILITDLGYVFVSQFIDMLCIVVKKICVAKLLILSLEKAFIEKWSSPDTESLYRAGAIKTPPLPRIEGIGKGTRYHLATVEKWLLKYFQKGGDPVEKR